MERITNGPINIPMAARIKSFNLVLPSIKRMTGREINQPGITRYKKAIEEKINEAK